MVSEQCVPVCSEHHQKIAWLCCPDMDPLTSPLNTGRDCVSLCVFRMTDITTEHRLRLCESVRVQNDGHHNWTQVETVWVCACSEWRTSHLNPGWDCVSLCVFRMTDITTEHRLRLCVFRMTDITTEPRLRLCESVRVQNDGDHNWTQG